jgi:hypothetical protein
MPSRFVSVVVQGVGSECADQTFVDRSRKLIDLRDVELICDFARIKLLDALE